MAILSLPTTCCRQVPKPRVFPGISGNFTLYAGSFDVRAPRRARRSAPGRLLLFDLLGVTFGRYYPSEEGGMLRLKRKRFSGS